MAPDEESRLLETIVGNGTPDDLLKLFENVRAHSHRRTRVLINSYNPLWRPLLGFAERLRLKPRKPRGESNGSCYSTLLHWRPRGMVRQTLCWRERISFLPFRLDTMLSE